MLQCTAMQMFRCNFFDCCCILCLLKARVSTVGVQCRLTCLPKVCYAGSHVYCQLAQESLKCHVQGQHQAQAQRWFRFPFCISSDLQFHEFPFLRRIESLTHLHVALSWPKLLSLSVRLLWRTVTAFLGQLVAVLSVLHETEFAALLLQFSHSPAAYHLHHHDPHHL